MTPLVADYWLGLVREVRLTHGRAAARYLVKHPLPQVPAMTSRCLTSISSCVDLPEITCRIKPEKRHDFVESSVYDQ